MNLELDHAEKIHYLMLIIKNICEENDLYIPVIIDDFQEIMNQKIIKKEASNEF